MSLAMPHRCLGLKKPVLDSRTLRLAKYVLTLPAPPNRVNWLVTRQSPWPMYANDSIGDCTCAAAGHCMIDWTDDSKLFVEPTVDQIIQAYSDVTGYDRNTGANDAGAKELDVLKYWSRTGIAGRKIGAFVAIDPKDIVRVKQAIWLFGGVYTGFALPQSAQNQEIWDSASFWRRSSWPWSWGGHALHVGAYNDQGHFTAITWAKEKLITEAFWKRYCIECWAVLSPDWLNPYSGVAVNGFDLATLTRDLKEVQR